MNCNVVKRLKKMRYNEYRVLLGEERIVEWRRLLDSEEKLEIYPESIDLGMPRSSTIVSPVENQAIGVALTSENLKQLIADEESRIHWVQSELVIINKVFSNLEEKELFLIRQRYYYNLNWVNITRNYAQKYYPELPPDLVNITKNVVENKLMPNLKFILEYC